MNVSNERLGQNIKGCVKGLLMAGAGVQIVLGIIWLIGSFDSMQLFSVSLDYEQAAGSLEFNRYTGILYVVLTALAMWLEDVIGISYFLPIYLVQVAVFLAAGYYFVDCMRGTRKKGGKPAGVMGALFLFTIPMLLQCHVAVMPQSLIVSVLLIMLGMCKKAVDGLTEISALLWGKMGLLWMVISLLLPDYLYLGAVPVIGLMVISFLKRGKLEKTGCLILLIFLISTCVVNAVVLKPAEDRMQKNFESAMVSRLVWPWFNQSYYFWPQEIKTVMSEEQALLIDADAEAVQRDFGPMVEQAYGRERASQLYLQMAKASFDVRTKEVLLGVGEDVKAYICTPLAVYGQLQGNGQVSYTGWNYKQMSEQFPEVTRPYVYGSLFAWFGEMICFVGVLVWKLLSWKKRSKEKTHSHAFYWIAGLCVLSQTIWYTMLGAGMMDYLNVPLITALWYALPMYFILQRVRDNG